MNGIRRKIVAANWKMNTTVTQGEKLVDEILKNLPAQLDCSLIIAPPFTHLPMLVKKVEGTKICSAAQNCHQEKSGAFTGEISVDMLSDLGVNYVIIGHSERRQLFHENNEVVKHKLNAVLGAGLLPIFCCGEPLDIRESERQNIFVHQQLEESLFHLDPDDFAKVCIAYEPIWAIGTGVTASPEQAQEMHMFIRDKIAIRYNKIVSETTSILYGGSIKADNAKTLFSQEDVDGGLVGGASLSPSGFLDIIRAACG
ncbi:MAG: triose-phosphate isomerase [Saprospiraceae bacterium]